MDRRARLRDARLYFVADRGGMEHALEGALAGGVDLFQLRDKDASDDELLAAAEIARERCHAAGALFVLNDRPDLAAAYLIGATPIAGRPSLVGVACTGPTAM